MPDPGSERTADLSGAPTSNGDTPSIPVALTNEPFRAHMITEEASASIDRGQDRNVLQMGVDFILSLEHVCLEHHSVWLPELQETGDLGATGHETMLQSPILHQGPPFSSDPSNYGRPSGSQWDVPAFELEKLLALSYRIHLAGEVTPIEAWAGIKSHADFNRLSNAKLQALGSTLQPVVRCYG